MIAAFRGKAARVASDSGPPREAFASRLGQALGLDADKGPAGRGTARRMRRIAESSLAAHTDSTMRMRMTPCS